MCIFAANRYPVKIGKLPPRCRQVLGEASISKLLHLLLTEFTQNYMSDFGTTFTAIFTTGFTAALKQYLHCNFHHHLYATIHQHVCAHSANILPKFPPTFRQNFCQSSLDFVRYIQQGAINWLEQKRYSFVMASPIICPSNLTGISRQVLRRNFEALNDFVTFFLHWIL